MTPEDAESRQVWAEGFIVKEASRLASNWRSRQQLHDYMHEAKIVGIEGLDTRALTRHLREHGSQQGLITHVDEDPRRAVEKAQAAPSIVGRDLAATVTCGKAYRWTEGSGEWIPSLGDKPRASATRRWHVVAYDFGVKRNILRRLVDVGCDVTVVPASATATQVEALKPDGIFLSNGPGDPEGVPYAVEAVRQLIGRHPVFGICLGHQILGLALGFNTYKLKFGHHGANHPVMDLRTRRVEITSQNHNFAVEVAGPISVMPERPPVVDTSFGQVLVTHLSLNDHSVEGLACVDLPVFSVQYHPEASPGPHDSAYLFTEFTQLLENQHE
jgi:carbamoyl-phosphate synthase small subunit